MEVWTQHPHPLRGPGEGAWRGAMTEWLGAWTRDAAGEGWAPEDGPLVWPEFMEELEDHGLDLAQLAPAEHAPIKALFLEVYAEALAAAR
ncbi:MAG: hypothetical protein KDD82_21045 [Planctomycetes bacterium]|nr:hypothetical protein [Planctomycetota bacterium]